MKISALSPKSPRRRGFTLLELVIAVVILAIISAVALPIYSTLQTNSQLSAEASQLANINREALSIATANGRSVPTAADITAALNDTPSFGAAAGLAATSSVTVSTSTSGTVIPSSSSTVLSADVSTGSVGLALNSPAGGCVMSLLVGTKVSSWFYKGALGYNCNGTQALQGNVVLSYSAGPAPLAPTGLTAGAGAGSTLLSWTASGTNGGSAISSYTVTYTDNTLGKTATSTCATGLYGLSPTSSTADIYATIPILATAGSLPTSPCVVSNPAASGTISFTLYPAYFSGWHSGGITGWADCSGFFSGNYNAFFSDSVTFTVTATNTAGTSTTSAPLTTTIANQYSLDAAIAGGCS